MKLAASLIIDILSTRYVPTPALFTLLVGQAGDLFLHQFCLNPSKYLTGLIFWEQQT